MRQYRGLTKDGKWVYGWYCKIQDEHYIIKDIVVILRGKNGGYIPECFLTEVIPETLGQSTGLKDKSGVEIYDNDQLLDGPYKIGYLVCYGESQFGHGWYLRNEAQTYRFDRSVSRMEIIGNIHQEKKGSEKC